MGKHRELLLKEFVKKLTRAARSIESETCTTFGVNDLTRPQADVVLFISSKDDGVTASQIASEFKVTAGAVSQVIDTLVAKGLVERAESDQDRRIQLITLSKKMLKHFVSFETSFIETVDSKLQKVSDTEVKQMIGLLSKIEGKYTDCDLVKGGEQK